MDCTLQLYKYMAKKVKKVKSLHDLVKILNKVDVNTLGSTYGVCSEFIRKLTHYFFTEIDEQSLSNSQCGQFS